MSERRFFLLDETIPASEIESFMCRVVTLKTLPHIKFAPFPPLSTGEPPHNTHDIIPTILPAPSLSTSRKEFVQVMPKREVKVSLTALFGFNFARNKDESRSLESELVKRYMLLDPEHHFQKLMQNEYYARDIRTLLESNKSHHAYLVTGFLTTTGTVWKIEAGSKRTNGFDVVATGPDLASDPVRGRSNLNIDLNLTTTTIQRREMCIAEEEIFAVSYSIVKLSYGFNRAALSITKTPIVGRPKRAKAYHLAMGDDDDDSDEEIEVSSDDDDEPNGNMRREGGINIYLGKDLIFVKEEESCTMKENNVYVDLK